MYVTVANSLVQTSSSSHDTHIGRIFPRYSVKGQSINKDEFRRWGRCSRLKSIRCNDRRFNDIAPAIDCHSDFNIVKGNVKTKLNAPSLSFRPHLRSRSAFSHSGSMRCDAAQDALNCSRPPCWNMKPRLT